MSTSQALKETFNQQQRRIHLISISYATHMHPMTQLKSPDLLDESKNSLFQITCQILYAALPLMLCFQLNIIPSIINLYLIGNVEGSEMMSAIGLGTVLANIFGFLIIENLSVGFSVLCSYFDDNKTEVGFMYQKTLGINFFVCIIVTPILYLSDKLFILLGFNDHIVEYSTQYIWALVPSFYLFSFYETTKNYLQSQGVVYPCLVISSIGCIFHYLIAFFLIEVLNLHVTGAAWAFNISLGINCLVLYFYIIKTEPTKESWIEWNICATNNLHKFLWEILTHQIFTYFQALAFLILAIIACDLKDPNEISAHFVLANSLHIVYFMVMGISQCINRAFSLSIEENDIKNGKKKITVGIGFILCLALIIVTNLISWKEEFFVLFHNDPGTVQAMRQTFVIFLIILLIDSFQVALFGILKTLEIKATNTISSISYYVIGLGFSFILSKLFSLNLKGIWIGWLAGVVCATILELVIFSKLDWEFKFDRVREKYQVIEKEIRQSRMEIRSVV